MALVGAAVVAVPVRDVDARRVDAVLRPAKCAWWRPVRSGRPARRARRSCWPASCARPSTARAPHRRCTPPPGSARRSCRSGRASRSIMSLALTPAASAAVPLHRGSSAAREPDLPGDHHAQHLGGADAEHVGAERAAGGRMRIAADAEHAGADVAVLRARRRGRCPGCRTHAAAPARRPSRARCARCGATRRRARARSGRAPARPCACPRSAPRVRRASASAGAGPLESWNIARSTAQVTVSPGCTVRAPRGTRDQLLRQRHAPPCQCHSGCGAAALAPAAPSARRRP